MVTGLVLEDVSCWFADFLCYYLMGLGVIGVKPCLDGCCMRGPLSERVAKCGGKTWFGVVFL